MPDYDNEMRGVLFKNDKQGNAKRPDYKGQCQVNGQEFWLSAWLAKDRNEKTYMQLRLEAKDGSGRAQQAGTAAPAPAPSPGAQFGDDIPF